MTFSVVTFILKGLYSTLSITILCHYVECHYAEFRYAGCHHAECRYAEFRYAGCHCAECRGAFVKIHHDIEFFLFGSAF